MCLFEPNSDENTDKGKGHAVLHTQMIDCPPGTNTLIHVLRLRGGCYLWLWSFLGSCKAEVTLCVSRIHVTNVV